MALFFACAAAAAPDSGWRLARSPHFELYFQASDAEARAALLWMEQLRVLVQVHTGLALDRRPPARIVAFRDTEAYDPYRVRAASDAYYVGTESRDYIVTAGLGGPDRGMAAHEYAHAVLREPAAGLPLWLREGLPELLATARLSPRGNTVGGGLQHRLETFRQEPAIPLQHLLTLTATDQLGNRAAMFYAQSWALADMVLLAPSYAPRFREFAAALAGGATSQQAFASVYGKSLEDVERDLKQRNRRHGRTPIALSGELPASVNIEITAVPELRARTLIAEVVMLSGDPDHAAALYRELERDAPNDPDVALGQGALALRAGDIALAQRHWKRAIAYGVSDPVLCFRYASLASMAGAPADEIRPALQRAIELQPDFDDARYSLALLEANAGNPARAVAQLRAMRHVAPARAFSYWTALADALTQTGDRDAAKSAARKALEYAAGEEERRHAASLLHVAGTDLAVRMTHDAEGRPHMVTTRIPHEAAEFNPFIEPGDNIERVEGTLREVDCSSELLRVVVATADREIALAIRGIDRVQIRNGPAEFTCGPQSGASVAVEYAKSKSATPGIAGDVRGMTFR